MRQADEPGARLFIPVKPKAAGKVKRGHERVGRVAELRFAVGAVWAGSGREGSGTLFLSGQAVPYSAPDTMGGRGEGTSPEELLLAAVASCYSGTLYRVVQRAGLPIARVKLRTEGVVSDYPRAARFSAITVHPTIVGGDVAKRDAYLEAAAAARNQCFIGRTVRDYLDYRVGAVDVQPA